MNWADVNWNALRRLRARFLEFDPRGQVQPGNEKGVSASVTFSAPDRADYWHSHSELASYDFTFGERIGWKWDTVLAELRLRGWAPPHGTLLDWGCGTGVASRRVLAAWPGVFDHLRLWDRSAPARRFAVSRARAVFPELTIEEGDKPGDLLVLSHVLNELTPQALDGLLAMVRRATAILWIEPGTQPVSRKLAGIRERLAGEFHVLAPCTHAAPCGLFAPGNEHHWCHHLARVPASVHTDSGWGKFAQTLELDLGRVPLSFLVLDRRPEPGRDPADARVLGEPRHYKGFAKVLQCQADGVRELTLQKRDAPDLFKEMKKHPGSLYHWRREGEKIVGGEKVF